MSKKIKKSCLSLVSNTNFEESVFIGKLSRIANSDIGFATYVGSGCKIVGTKIGRFCSIGSGVKIIFGTHPTSKMVSTHPAFYSVNPPTCRGFVTENSFEEYNYVDEKRKYYVSIGNDVWICDDVKIMQGVKIADGAVIATGAVVTKDVGPYEIVGGVPAKIIKKRFTDDIIVELLKIKWWNKDLDWIKTNSWRFIDCEKFIDFIKEENGERERC